MYLNLSKGMMRLKCDIKKDHDTFYPILIENNKIIFISDHDIATKFGLTYEEYTKFIIQNKGYQRFDCYYFKTKEECQNFIEKIIEPRLIMEKLIK